MKKLNTILTITTIGSSVSFAIYAMFKIRKAARLDKEMEIFLDSI